MLDITCASIASVSATFIEIVGIESPKHVIKNTNITSFVFICYIFRTSVF
ncbi:hypothetical protein KL86DYS2_11617 [uncultured Dysgonomonas sp.]|uniref:Uncharacterized protein n=1 Tax=uncultured Dysgonomonas sp. TaxID=206096 RepID=A0A212JJ33_9BACT|nr:hypothetical protein KL86DYS2_11617 [uncultured Dysgonomonas sp.]